MLHFITTWAWKSTCTKSIMTIMHRLMCLSYLTSGFDFRAILNITGVCNVLGFVSYSADLCHNWERGVQTAITCGMDISLKKRRRKKYVNFVDVDSNAGSLHHRNFTCSISDWILHELTDGRCKVPNEMQVCWHYHNFAYHDVADIFVGVVKNSFIPHMSERLSDFSAQFYRLSSC
jgi:hypothetical protein